MAPPLSGSVLVDLPVASALDAIDPVNGPLAGRQNITVRASGAPTKEALLALPGFMVVQSFPGSDGAVLSPVNRIDFSDGRPTITFTINATSGYRGVPIRSERELGLHLGAGGGRGGHFRLYRGQDQRYDLRHRFSEPVHAVSFVMARTLQSIAGSTPNWVASFYDANGGLLECQIASPVRGANVAALFGRISPPNGAPIKRMVFGRDAPGTPFVMGNGAAFFDDLDFVPGVGGAAARAQGGMARPRLALAMGGTGRESVDFPANGASSQTFMQRLDEYGVVQNWSGFIGLAGGAREAVNTLDFGHGLDFRFRL